MSTSPRRRVPMQKSAPRMRKADRKRQLLIHAKHLFVTLGYQNTTTEKIARAAGVSEPVLYRHFENKKALFLEVLQEIRAATLHRWHAETTHLTDPLAKLHRIADLYLGTTREHALEFRIMHRTLIDTDDEEIAAFLQSLVPVEAMRLDIALHRAGYEVPEAFPLGHAAAQIAARKIDRWNLDDLLA